MINLGLKRGFICFLIFVVSGLSLMAQKTYFVAPDGNDNAVGSKEQPFASWQKGHDVAAPGDTIYLRGGTYQITGNAKYGVIMRGRDGKPGKLIQFWAWPGENPVLDCAGMTTKEPGADGILFENSYWHLKGIEVKNVPMNIGSPQGSGGIKGFDCNHNIFEELNCHHNAGTGFRLYKGSSYNLILNSDFHHNYDPLTPNDPGGNSDGASIAFTKGNPLGNVFRGCRAWQNSDDGFDLWKAESPITFENCWSFWNGFIPDTKKRGGDGNGFKMGRNKTGPKHILKRCLAFENNSNGFDDNVGLGVQLWINNTAYNNGADNYHPIQAFEHILRNNLSVGAVDSLNTAVDDQYNSWNLKVNVDASNFLSTNSKGMDGPRQPDGSLPDLPFLKLTRDSDLIDKGIILEGIDYNGKSPDLGCFESNY